MQHGIPVKTVCLISQSCLKKMPCHLHKGNLPNEVIISWGSSIDLSLLLGAVKPFQMVKNSKTWQVLPAIISWGQTAVWGSKQMYRPAGAAPVPSPRLSLCWTRHCCQQLQLTSPDRRRGRCSGGEGLRQLCACWMWCSPHRHTVQVRHFPSHNQLPHFPSLRPLWEKTVVTTAPPAVLPTGNVDKPWSIKHPSDDRNKDKRPIQHRFNPGRPLPCLRLQSLTVTTVLCSCYRMCWRHQQ